MRAPDYEHMAHWPEREPAVLENAIEQLKNDIVTEKDAMKLKARGVRFAKVINNYRGHDDFPRKSAGRQ